MVLMMDKKEEDSSSTDYDSDNVRNMVTSNSKRKIHAMNFMVSITWDFQHKNSSFFFI